MPKLVAKDWIGRSRRKDDYLVAPGMQISAQAVGVVFDSANTRAEPMRHLTNSHPIASFQAMNKDKRGLNHITRIVLAWLSIPFRRINYRVKD